MAEPSLAGDLVVLACSRGAGWIASAADFHGARVVPVECAGSLHTSFVEGLLRSGATGVLVASCPPRDCWNREGPRWLEGRLYHDREAELQARVDRRRVGLVFAGGGEGGRVAEALARLRASVAALERLDSEEAPDLERECARDGEEKPGQLLSTRGRGR
jgi:coenzyme F420-reducing hydrogenase delta subunit